MSDIDPGEGLVWACEPFAAVSDFDDCECDCDIDLTDPTQEALFSLFLDAATDELCLLSGNELRGICTDTFTVCREGCSCRGTCGCQRDVIMLRAPIVSIESITFEDYTFVATDFEIVDDVAVRWARDTDPGYWPSGKDITIVESWGHPVDQIVKNATLELACAAMRSCLTEGGRKIPADSVQRQGIGYARGRTSVTADAAQKAVNDYPWMAKFLSVYNPKRSIFPPDVWAPEFDDLHVLRAL